MTKYSISSPAFTINGIKKKAKRIKREQNVAHCEALNIAAKISGYHGYQHALRTLQKIDIDGGSIQENSSRKPATINEGEVTALYEDLIAADGCVTPGLPRNV
jgi:exopolyphosphatase/pppGpp-phosphohydrolase